MSDTLGNTGADGTSTDDVRDEVRLDLDEGSLDTWDEVRKDYALDPESEVARPALAESEEDDEDDLSPSREDDEEDDLAEDDDDSPNVHEEE